MKTTRTQVMGVVNVTPDSFSDGGRWLDPQIATAHGVHLSAQGADIVDVGGESTRPGAQRISSAEELNRTLPVVRSLVDAGVPVSVDTMRSEVATAALRAGAIMINDVSGGKSDPAMAEAIASAGCDYVVGHWRGHSASMDEFAVYTDVVEEVLDELLTQIELLVSAGIGRERIIVDPNLGFAKRSHDNWRILAEIGRFVELGYRVLIGASRKRFLGDLLVEAGTPSDPLSRDSMTAAVSAIAASEGVWGVRVHDVPPTVDAVRVACAIAQAGVEEVSQ